MVELIKNGNEYPVLDLKSANVSFLLKEEYDLLSTNDQNNGMCYMVVDALDVEGLRFVELNENKFYFDNNIIYPNFLNYDEKSIAISGDTFATNCGEYTTYFTPKEGYCWLDGTVVTISLTWNIVLRKPILTSDDLYFTGSAQSPSYDYYYPSNMTMTGDTSATNIGNYEIIFTPNPGITWEDGSTDPVKIYWAIKRAICSLHVEYDKSNVKFLSVGETFEITYTTNVIDPYLLITNSDPTVASMTISDNTILVTVLKEGLTTISIYVDPNSPYTITREDIVVDIRYHTLSIQLDLNNPNPETWAVYLDDAVGLEYKDAAFEKFFGEYPVILINDTEYPLNPDNFAQYIDGTSAPIGVQGNDIMVAFPRRGINMVKDIENNTLTISITDNPNDPNFTYYAHTYKNENKSKFYLGSYPSYISGLRSTATAYSMSGISSSNTTYSYGNYYRRTYAHNRGTNYEIMAWYQYLYIQILYTLKYKAKDSKNIFGDGNTFYQTGFLNNKGMNYEAQEKITNNISTVTATKIFGLEHWISGTYPECIDGAYYANGYFYTSLDSNYATTESYTLANPEQQIWGYSGANIYLKEPIGNNMSGFVSQSTESGSNTTYFCSYQYINASTVFTTPSFFMKGYNHSTSSTSKTYSGIYSLRYENGDWTSRSNSRLMYFPLESITFD